MTHIPVTIDLIWPLLALFVWVGMGLLCWPVIMVRYHHMMGHNKGWTWRTTLLGRHNNRSKATPCHNVRHWVRVVVGHVILVLAWPVGLYEARPRPKRTRRTIERAPYDPAPSTHTSNSATYRHLDEWGY